MSVRPRLLDTFCKAGGCTKGYQRAGFYVVGVDIEPQPRYCGDEFVQGDALEFIAQHGHEFDVIHASPPCQGYSSATKHLALPKPLLLGPIRELLMASGKPYVIENVPGAPLLNPVLVCGSALGLRVIRHRLFECSWFAFATACYDHGRAMNPHRAKSRQKIGYAPELQWRKAMGVDWMNKAETRQAIPPAYTEFIGRQLIDQLARPA